MGNKPRKYKILAFDPGIGNTGWSLLEGNEANGNLVVLKVGEFHPGPTSALARYREEVEKFDKRTISLTLLQEEETKLIETYHPDFICCEDIYISMAHPQAYGSLAMWVCTTKLTAWRHGYRLTAIPTKICKQVITGTGGAGKIDVRDAIMKNGRITFKNEDDAKHLSEHEADSIAVGAALNDRYRDFVLATINLQGVK
jgi:Holliday junction resolvasome RuvABC endonuclease subunit